MFKFSRSWFHYFKKSYLVELKPVKHRIEKKVVANDFDLKRSISYSDSLPKFPDYSMSKS